MKKLWNRESLKSFFRKGQLPSQVHFEYLIESTVNKLDDGFAKSNENGLQLSPIGGAESVISILKDPIDPDPSWQMSVKNNEQGSGLSFDSVGRDTNNKIQKTSRLFLDDNGNIGIGTTKPYVQLEVAGTLGMSTRLGTFKVGQVPGNGEWHDVVDHLDGIQAFEVVARIEGPPKRGKYALTHAIAISTFGGSKHRIHQTRAHFGWFMNRIEFRWQGSIHQYSLQVRTRSHYGLNSEQNNYMIRFHVTRLWDDSIFNT